MNMLTDNLDNVQPDPMALAIGEYVVIGYSSPNVGLIWYEDDEHFRPFIVCRNSIVRTDNGPAVVTEVNGRVVLEPVGGMQQ